MKRVLVAAMLLLGTVSVFAAEGKIDREKGKQEVKKEVKKMLNPPGLTYEQKSCTVTIGGEVGFFPFFEVEIKCTATATTCKEASDDAQACLKYNIEKAKKVAEDYYNTLMAWLAS